MLWGYDRDIRTESNSPEEELMAQWPRLTDEQKTKAFLYLVSVTGTAEGFRALFTARGGRQGV